MHNIDLYIEDTQDTRKGSIVQINTDPAPAGYLDVSNSITDWDTYGPRNVGIEVMRSYLILRDEISELVSIKGFANCSQQEKLVASRWFVVDKAERDTVRSEWEQFTDSQNLLGNINSDNSELCLFSVDQKLAQLTVDVNGNLLSNFI